MDNEDKVKEASADGYYAEDDSLGEDELDLSFLDEEEEREEGSEEEAENE